MKRKVITLLLGMVLVFLAACGEKQEPVTQEPVEESTEAEPESETETEIDDVTPEPEVVEEDLMALEYDGVKIRFFHVEGVDVWGDCTYLEFPNGENMLIDTGLTNAAKLIVEELLDYGIDHIDHFVLSHGHADHVQGVSNVLGNMTVGKAYSSGYFTTDFQWVYRDLEGRGVEHVQIAAGDRFQIGDVTFDVLWPTQELAANPPQNDSKVQFGPGSTEDMNNSSLVMQMTYKDNKVLFTGDIYESGEGEILKYYADNLDVLKTDVLKLQHHGKDTSCSEAFTKAVSPKYAVSMGTYTMTNVKYKYFAEIGCYPYFSWMNGNVYVLLDGTNITVTPDNPEIKDYYQAVIDQVQ